MASGSPSQSIASRPSCRSSSRAEKCGEVTWHPMDASVAAGFADTAGFIALGDGLRSLEFPSERNNMTTTVDVIVLGTGSAAQIVAYTCRSAGWSVAVVDSRPFGGTCENRGCEPKK